MAKQIGRPKEYNELSKLSITMDSSTKQKIELIAGLERRSVSKLITIICEEFIKEYKEK